MKKILVIGANGRVGNRLVRVLANRGYQVLAASRHVDEGTSHEHISPVYLDLLAEVDVLTEALKDNIDAVYFVSGSRGKNLLQIDLHGAVKTMQAAEKAGVKRFILLSSVFALQPERWNEAFLKDLMDYNIAKHYADLYLSQNTTLDYTILQPGALKETTGSGKISVNVDQPGENSIDNVVEALVFSLEEPATIGKVITMHDGDTPIREALKVL